MRIFDALLKFLFFVRRQQFVINRNGCHFKIAVQRHYNLVARGFDCNGFFRQFALERFGLCAQIFELFEFGEHICWT